jgi:hypothetical protein
MNLIEKFSNFMVESNEQATHKMYVNNKVYDLYVNEENQDNFNEIYVENVYLNKDIKMYEISKEESDKLLVVDVISKTKLNKLANKKELKIFMNYMDKIVSKNIVDFRGPTPIYIFKEEISEELTKIRLIFIGIFLPKIIINKILNDLNGNSICVFSGPTLEKEYYMWQSNLEIYKRWHNGILMDAPKINMEFIKGTLQEIRTTLDAKWRGYFYLDKNIDINERWGIKWLKNRAEDSHAQDKMLEILPESYIPIVSLTKTFGRMWSAISLEKLASIITVNHGLYEILPINMQRKVYFDIDGKVDTLPQIKELLMSTFPDCKLQISGNIEPNVKFSYHIIISNYYLNNLEETLVLRDWLVEFQKENGDIGIDTRVYTKNRNMKIINQSKIGAKVQEYMEGSLILTKHLILADFDDDAQEAIKYINPKYDATNVEKSNGMATLNNIPQMEMVLPEDIKDIYTTSAINILKLIPNPPRNEGNSLNHNVVWCVANYAYNNGVTFEDFWSWCQGKDNTMVRKNKYLSSHWNSSIPKSEVKIDIYYMVLLLERFYPNIRKGYEKRMYKRMHEIESTKIIESYYFKKEELTEKKYQVLNLPMGSGKTAAIIDYLTSLDINKSFIWITPRRSLAQNTMARLEEVGLKVVHYSDVGKSKEEKKSNMSKENRLVIQCESLHYLGLKRQYDVVVIDEVESVLNTWISETHGNNLLQNWDNFKGVVGNSGKVIMLDAFTSMKTISFIRDLEGDSEYPIEIISRKEPNPERKMVMVNKYKDIGKNRQEWLNIMVQYLREGKSIFCFYPHKRGNARNYSITEVESILKEQTKDVLKDDDFIVYHGEMSDKQAKDLKKVNEVWKSKKCVITNSTITVGVNFDIPDDFSAIFVGFSSFVRARDVIQSAYRIRKLKEDKIYVVKLDKGGYNGKDYYMQTLPCKVYEGLQNLILVEERAKKYFSTFKYMAKLANYKLDKTEYPNIELKTEKDWQKMLKGMQGQSIFDWNRIPDIDVMDLDSYLNRIYCHDGSQDDKLIIMKSKFKSYFADNISDKEIEGYWKSKDYNLIKRYSEYINNPMHIFHQLRGELNQENINIPDGKIEISDSLRKRFFEEFKFDRLSTKISAKNIISKALNVYFGRRVYGAKKTGTHSIWSMDPAFILLEEELKRVLWRGVDEKSIKMFSSTFSESK